MKNKLNKIFNMAIVDLKKIYRGAALGWFWVIAKPAVTIFVYWFAFAIGLKVGKDINGFPYYLWLIVGLLPWMYIGDIISCGPDFYRKYSYLVTKIKFPTNIIPTFLSFSRLIVNLSLTLIVLIIYYFEVGSFDIYFVELPLYIILMYMLFTNLGGIFAIIGSISKDFSNLIKTLPMPILFLSSVFYTTESISIPWVKTLQMFNPVTTIADGFRNVFIYKAWFFDDIWVFIIFILEIILLRIIFIVLYKRVQKEMPDYL